MRNARRISQIFFFSLFLFLFLQTTFPYLSFIPVDIFLRADPLIAFITIITTKQLLVGTFVLAFIILMLTIFFGRFFCGWICPLGTVLDFSDRLTKKNRKKKSATHRKYRLWKYALFIGIVTAAIFSLQLIWFFDPISLLTRSFTASIYPLFAYLVESILNLLIKIGLFEDTLYSVYDVLRGSILPVEPIFFRQSVVIILIILTILLLGLITKRFWCRYLCPLGALFAIFSNFRILKRTVNEDCTDCGLCYVECKMDAINKNYRSYSQIECIECMNCVAVCPSNAVKYKINIHKSPAKLDVTKRRLIFSGLGGLLTVGITKTAFIDKANAGAVIRPPGSLPESEFLERCLRCHECIKICSTAGKCLQPVWLESGWEGIWTPMADARYGYCEYECNLCGFVCPTGAIHQLGLKKKQQMPIGTAYFDKSRCIPWYRNADCIVCEEHCPTPEKAIKFEIRTIKKHDGTIKEVKFPYVDENLCIGCGICVTKCPLVGKAGIFVTSARQQRWEEE